MFDDFGKKYGYKMRAEYLIDQGYYNQTHRVPIARLAAAQANIRNPRATK